MGGRASTASSACRCTAVSRWPCRSRTSRSGFSNSP